MALKGVAHLYPFDVVSNERVADGIYRVVIHAQGIASELEPGQFLNLAVPGDPSQILRIPLSFSRADRDDDTVEIEYAVVGDGTRRLSTLMPGTTSTAVAPCGHPWRTYERQGRAVLVAGASASLPSSPARAPSVRRAPASMRSWGPRRRAGSGARTSFAPSVPARSW